MSKFYQNSYELLLSDESMFSYGEILKEEHTQMKSDCTSPVTCTGYSLLRTIMSLNTLSSVAHESSE